MKKQKTDLFRFVTMRSPEHISADNKTLGFILPTLPYMVCHFLSKINESDIAQSRTDMENAVSTFTPYEKLEQLKNEDSELWEFSDWLAKNKNKLKRSEIDAKVPTNLPAGTTLVQLWDNLYFDLLTDTNPFLRQGCLQMLVAHYFHLNYTTHSPGTTTDPDEIAEEARLLKRLANSKVLIHYVLANDKVQTSASTIDFNFQSKRNLKPQHKANLSLCLSKDLTAIQVELNALLKTFRTDFEAARLTAKNAYEADISNTISTYLTNNPGTTEDTIPDDLIPSFNFNFHAPLGSAFTSGKLSGKAQAFITEQSLEESSVQEALNVLQSAINKQKTTGSQQKRHKISSVLINGVITNPVKSAFNDYVFSFEEDTFDEAPGEYRMFLSIDAGYESAFIASSTYKLTINGTTIIEPTVCPKVLCTNGSIIFVELFIGKSLSFADCSRFLFEASIELDNGKTVVIYKNGNASILCYTGAAIASKTLNDAVSLYGVNRMGIADYRRVEQELCCYIPGEVSHIENVMAAEYKEKITRNLTRSEVSLETTSNTEIENLSDTSSTDRNEVSSEISEVLQKDKNQNFGFSASTSGKIIKDIGFTANAYGDFSMAQSASDSNTQARNYSEDVTRRAMERVIQKTSIKRSSKMIREFEETNKHGFDNREGTTNVTGVYRWVDKVYKNSIVNYGKRLMYEFMIPEPSKWYKDAIILKAEEEGDTLGAGDPSSPRSAVIKPSTLQENGISGPSDITRDNYQRIAALYGASPEAPMDATATVSGNYGGNPGRGDAEKAFTHDGLLVPPNYVCRQIDGNVSLHFRAMVPAYGYIKAGVAGRNFTKSNLIGEGDYTLDLDANGLNVTGAVSVSIVTKKVTTYNVSVQLICELQPTILEQWQQETYDEIRRAYDAKIQAFSDTQLEAQASIEMSQAEADENADVARNPRFNGMVIHTELKRLCIEMLSKPFGYAQGKDFYRTTKCDVPELELTMALDQYASQVKFFEQAFDWELLSKQFYAYYWADKCDWKALYQEQDSNDPIFQQFLQSGMGRVVVPVREGFEDAVVFFMETGKIWSGQGMVIDRDDDLYVSIADEMMHLEGRLEGEEWETIVPTSLTVIQASSVALDEGGLPCCETDPTELAALNLETSTTILTRDSGTTPA